MLQTNRRQREGEPQNINSNKKVGEIPQLQTADKSTAPGGRTTQQSLDIRKTN